MEQQRLKELRIVIIEESDEIKEALRGVFAESEGCHLVGMASEPFEGLRLVSGEQPDVVLMDVSPPQPGIELRRTHVDGLHRATQLRPVSAVGCLRGADFVAALTVRPHDQELNPLSPRFR